MGSQHCHSPATRSSEIHLTFLTPPPHPCNVLPFHNVYRRNKGIKVILLKRQSTRQEFIIHDKLRACVWWGERKAAMNQGNRWRGRGILDSLLSASWESFCFIQEPRSHFAPRPTSEDFLYTPVLLKLGFSVTRPQTHNNCAIIDLEILFSPSENSQFILIYVG